MLPSPDLEADLQAALLELERQPLAVLLHQHGILRNLARDLLMNRLLDSVQFNAQEQGPVLSKLWEGLREEPPPQLAPGWLEALAPELRVPIGQRWDQIRLQKWLEVQYGERVEPYLLERRAALEQVVFALIRVGSQGTAEELYLRLIDDGANFGDLAQQFSIGDERLTHGLLGPMPISQPHPRIQAVLHRLRVGDLHPPIQLDQCFLILRLEHRQPASLNGATRQLLLQELFQQDLQATLDSQLPAALPQLLQAA
jgi:parvulin-like peptidyl-prolyl isomerase